jgi:hypothetical protein
VEIAGEGNPQWSGCAPPRHLDSVKLRAYLERGSQPLGQPGRPIVRGERRLDLLPEDPPAAEVAGIAAGDRIRRGSQVQ